MEATPRLSLPMLVPGQAQKELFHNEALARLDAIVAAAVEEPPRNDPPASVENGACYIIGSSPVDEWSQYADHLAAFGSAGWRYVAPAPGLSVWIKTSANFATYGPSGWEIGTVRASRLIVEGEQVVGPRAAPIADPAGGLTVDAEARAALGQVLAALRQHGLIAQ